MPRNIAVLNFWSNRRMINARRPLTAARLDGWSGRWGTRRTAAAGGEGVFTTATSNQSHEGSTHEVSDAAWSTTAGTIGPTDRASRLPWLRRAAWTGMANKVSVDEEDEKEQRLRRPRGEKRNKTDAGEHRYTNRTDRKRQD